MDGVAELAVVPMRGTMVMLADPLNETPLIVRAVVRVAALPVVF
jgi:hypothetical protein